MGEHRKPSRRRRRWPVVALAAALVLTAGIAWLGIRLLNACRPVDVLVAADPAVAEPVRRALAAERKGDAACARYEVVDAPPSLAGDIDSGAAGLPAVWIPESSLALGTLGTGKEALVDAGASLASSPVVVVVPRDDADRYGDPARPVPWNAMLTHPQPPALPDPTTDDAGLAALTALRTQIGDEGDRPRPAFVAAVLALAEGSLPSDTAGFDAVDRDGATARAFLASEQAVVRHDQGRGAQVDGLALADGPAGLDFPFVRVRAGQPSGLDAAVDDLEAHLRGPAGREALATAGLRGPDGSRLPGPAATTDSIDDGGWLGAQVPSIAPPDRPAAVETLRLWSSLTLQSRVLAVIDVSSSMAARAGDTDRIGLAAGAAQGGLALFSDVSSVGLWAFSFRPPQTPWQELVPIGRLDDRVAGAPSRRAALVGQAATLRDRLGGETALYDTALAATRAVRAGYEAGSANAVVLITDGRNEVGGGIDLPTVLQILRAEADPTRPVPVIGIGLGPDADLESLREIARATGGQSYVARVPEDIRSVFFDALSQRTCRPSC